MVLRKLIQSLKNYSMNKDIKQAKNYKIHWAFIK